MATHNEDVERLQEKFEEERSKLLHQIAQLQTYAPSTLIFIFCLLKYFLIFNYSWITCRGRDRTPSGECN